MRYRISGGELSAEFDGLGAEAVSVCFRGRERLWQNENGSWTGHAPVLFPVCGNCGVRIDGGTTDMGRHGFARKSLFTAAEQTDCSIRFVLTENEDTLRVYPFPFRFTVGYRLSGNALMIRYQVENTGKREMPFSWGGHVSHLLPSFEGISLLFSTEETFSARIHDGDGLLTGERRSLGQGRRLSLSAALPEGGKTLIFGDVRSRSVVLEKDGEPLARLDFAGFRHLMVWRPQGAEMICVEPWDNLPDFVADKRDLREKVRLLPAGKRANAVQVITYCEERS